MKKRGKVEKNGCKVKKKGGPPGGPAVVLQIVLVERMVSKYKVHVMVAHIMVSHYVGIITIIIHIWFAVVKLLVNHDF